jgi:hypothetical protein
MELLEKGYSVKAISKLAKVSESYIYHLRKHGVDKPEVTEDMKAALQLISQDKDLNELAYRITKGTGRTPPDTSVDAVLAERGSRYGNFIDHARITQELKRVSYDFFVGKNKQLADDQQEALDMIFHKIGRILNGDPNYADSWIDIAGYATLVADRLEGKVQ